MKRYLLYHSVILLLILFGQSDAVVSAQMQLPSIQINNLKGENVNTKSLLNDSIPVVISFWSTICKPCIQELDAFADQWVKWQHEVRFKLIAVSTDDARSKAKVHTFAAVNDWPFTILLDSNQDFKRALNVSFIPHLYIIAPKGNVVYSRIGYTPGSEEKVLEVLKGL